MKEASGRTTELTKGTQKALGCTERHPEQSMVGQTTRQGPERYQGHREHPGMHQKALKSLWRARQGNQRLLGLTTKHSEALGRQQMNLEAP